ncbi:MAG TPA: type III pantothenate kinase [Candidatus Caccousia stercoris]|uniref:Type III pantothenate kinase n=1 Tax=Candidatus Caccousia stercoris TaxID=2840723 RepID=A0A9D1FR71_9FIRM|nr:type III pantothenate kinase [Candidatus Caccousia stercoris]
MIIAIDIGNTNIVLGCLEPDTGRLLFTARLSSDRVKTSDEYAALMRNMFILNQVERHDIEGSIISSVVPTLTVTMKDAIRQLCGQESLIVGAGLKTGLNIVMDNPAQLGSDLVTDAVAAAAEYPKPILIFDLGTATTLSVVDKRGNYVGGMIIPGIAISLEALSSHTSQLPHINLEGPKRVIGTNTIDCMKSGIVYGNAAMIDGIIERVSQELGEKPTVVATGGLAPNITKYCKSDIICDSELILKGLRILYNKNKP